MVVFYFYELKGFACTCTVQYTLYEIMNELFTWHTALYRNSRTGLGNKLDAVAFLYAHNLLLFLIFKEKMKQQKKNIKISKTLLENFEEYNTTKI